MKKYVFSEETINLYGKTLHRIKATRDFSNVHVGDLGGFIEDERNLSHDENARVGGNAWVKGNALFKGTRDIFWISHIGSRDGTTTFFRNADNGISVSCGCFYGTIDEFAAAVTKTHGDNEHAQAYRHAIEIAKLRIKLEDAES